MIDALGIEREPGMPYCKQGHKDNTGIYVLVHRADHTPDCWRYRSGPPEFLTLEARPHEFENIDDFRRAVFMGAARRQVRHGSMDFDQRNAYERMMRIENPEPVSAGYDPLRKRMTCHAKCNALEWHKYGGISQTWKCTRCGNEVMNP